MRCPLVAVRRPRALAARHALGAPAVVAVIALLHVTSTPLVAQEKVPPAPADSAASDTLAATPDSLRAETDSLAATPDSLIGPLDQPLEGTLQDSVAELPFARLPALHDLPADGGSSVVADLTLDDMLQSNALTLLELLEEHPGLTPLRASWFGGPQQATSGAVGPGFVTVLLDGREVPTMDGGQPDLTRFPLAALQRVRVVRTPAGWRIELSSLSRIRRDAYSRIEGGTGDPGLSRLRLVFDNGFGRTVRVAASADLVDVTGDFPSSDFDFFGLVEWVPGDERSGLAFTYESETMDRDVYAPVNLRRTETFLRGRFPFGDALQLQLFGGWTGWRPEEETAAPDTEPVDRSVLSGGATLRGDWDRLRGGVSLSAWDSEFHPGLQIDGDVGGRVVGPLSAELGGRYAAWNGFDATELRGGVALDLPLHLKLRAGASTGTRGIGYPTAGVVDSLGFTMINGRLEFSTSALALYGLVERQELDRQLPFRSSFDRFQQPVEDPAALTAFEVGGSIPILPLAWLIKDSAPIRLGGFWRYQDFAAADGLLYAPQYLMRGTLGFDDEFFDGNLGVRMGLGVKHRGNMVVPTAEAVTEPSSARVGVPAYTYLDWNMAIRVLTVVIYYRYDNITGTAANDFVGLPFPNTRSVFGVKWTFLN